MVRPLTVDDKFGVYLPTIPMPFITVDSSLADGALVWHNNEIVGLTVKIDDDESYMIPLEKRP